MTVDLSPILQTLIQLGAIALMALGAVVIRRLAVKLGLDAHDVLAARLDDALDKSIQAGAMQVIGAIRAKGWDHPEIKDRVLRLGAEYLLRQWPELVKQAGLDSGDLAGTLARVTALLERAFPTAIAPVANSPATPPAPPPAAATAVSQVKPV